jgi:2-(1,2-epoxy-1,2-dihydrophenyl)acetyl-CoA isomerase
MMLGDKVTAEEAERIGMIYKVFDDNEFSEASIHIATTLSQMPTQGLAYTKEALNSTYTNTLEQQLSLEDKLQFKSGNTEDYREGIAAFTEKRKPVFNGK